MKNYKKTVLVAGALFAFASCKKGNYILRPIQLTASDTGKTLNISIRQSISVTLGNPGDGGFTDNAWQYDAAVLHLDSHTRIPPPNSGNVGDFGSDNWKFTALKSGTTILKITASQSPAYTVTLFSDTIKVK